MEFKDRLKALRKEKGLTQSKLGELLNYGYTAIANYESGRNQPSISDLKKIAAVFDVSMDYLLCVNDIRRSYMAEDDSPDLNEFLQYYFLLKENSREELLDYMRYLVYKEKNAPTENEILYKESKLRPVILKVAQIPDEYTK